MYNLDALTLEKDTRDFIEELLSKGETPLHKLTPAQARAALEELQAGSIDKQQVDIEDIHIPGGSLGSISVRIVRPQKSTHLLPIIVYIHGAGWVMGSAATHDRLVREIAVTAHAAVAFVNYPLSPEARFPKAIEEAYAVMQYLFKQGKQWNLDGTRLAVCGDSVGGNMAIATTLLAKTRKGPSISCQVLFYPVTHSALSSASYTQFAQGPWLTKPAMQWFWDAYESDHHARQQPLLSPLNATMEQLTGLPPALVITAENDVLRDEGEAYAKKLIEAGARVTAVRFLGTIHDFVMLHALAHTPAARGALALAGSYLHQALEHSPKKPL